MHQFHWTFEADLVTCVFRALESLKTEGRNSRLWEDISLDEVIKILEDLIEYFAPPSEDMGKYTVKLLLSGPKTSKLRQTHSFPFVFCWSSFQIWLLDYSLPRLPVLSFSHSYRVLPILAHSAMFVSQVIFVLFTLLHPPPCITSYANESCLLVVLPNHWSVLRDALYTA